MRAIALIAGALAGMGKAFDIERLFKSPTVRNFGPTGCRRVRGKAGEPKNGMPQSTKDDTMPRGYAGAKLARKAIAGKVGVCH